ncbi:N2227-domain-containing protein [Venustampulla echinocandica]|uniref:carnosine N-methyltransferase n=1 Tax=Venustampulla echinocandica TaxID=2656787 RepID=A0A370TY21_9HELO|nr:N2227-domain-containing protein [Venustampulla echinocandica]RDL40425.1 N2227-domain-containing protein [Venustampulla echinocandica]
MSSPEWQGNNETYNDAEERRVLLGALSSFYQYAKVAHYNTTHLRRQSFYALPRAHWELLAQPPFSYLETLDAVDSAIDKNAELAAAILEAGLQSFGLTQPSNQETIKQDDWRELATPNDLEKARSSLRQFYRDWSEGGRAEREACFGPVMRALRIERSNRSGSKLRVLVPGAGLGRLVFDLCCDGFDAEGNEISYHQLLASSYILNHCPEARSHTIYPWAHSFSNHKNRANHLMSVQVPDVNPGVTLGNVEGAGQMSMSASDFLLLYSDEDQRDSFDAVATVFFLDTAPNIIRYIEAIRNCLKKGGLLVNVGPLLWHFENNAPGTHGREKDPSHPSGSCGIADPGSVELTDDEVVALVEKLGFEIELRESGIAAPYIQDPESMIQNIYQATHWVARKK